jgi:MORN repeat
MSMAHGEQGVYTNTLGDIFVGSWKFDQRHGPGRELWPRDNSTFEGTYTMGEREGFGKFIVNN